MNSLFFKVSSITCANILCKNKLESLLCLLYFCLISNTLATDCLFLQLVPRIHRWILCWRRLMILKEGRACLTCKRTIFVLYFMGRH